MEEEGEIFLLTSETSNMFMLQISKLRSVFVLLKLWQKSVQFHYGYCLGEARGQRYAQ